MNYKPGLDNRTCLLSREEAETLALKLFIEIANDSEALERFLALTGLMPHSLRAAVESPGFYPSVLDYICGNENDLLTFAGRSGLKPEAIAAAHRLLSPQDLYG